MTGKFHRAEGTEASTPAEKPSQPEPWLRGTLKELPAAERAVLHALQLAREDIERWCEPLRNDEWNARPYGLPPAAFHLRHIAGSLDRLLSYAEGKALTAEQLEWMSREMDSGARSGESMEQFRQGLSAAEQRIRAIGMARWAESRAVGRKQAPSTVAGLLIHCAEHTQRHVGQATTTAKLLIAMRSARE